MTHWLFQLISFDESKTFAIWRLKTLASQLPALL